MKTISILRILSQPGRLISAVNAVNRSILVRSIGVPQENQNGRVWTAKTCAPCYELRRTFVCGGWIFGHLRDEIEQNMFPIWDEGGPFDCLSKLDTIEARRKVNQWYDDYRGEVTGHGR